jgi:Na+-transporting NADH:ubiquinone oxidoreductase subunit C
MVVIVATLLTFISLQLKPRQEGNIRIEKMQNILASVRQESSTKNAEELFNKYITNSFVLDLKGDTLSDLSAFDVDLKKEVDKIKKIKLQKAQLAERRISPFKKFLSSFISFKEVNRNNVMSKIEKLEKTRELPVYVYSKDDGSSYYVFPLRGKGLWGPIWGYISLESDMNTVYGAVFDHKSETPGLGAEINQEWFQKDFQGKKIFEKESFKSIEVAKPGTVETTEYTVDAISGGTITSKGVQEMLYDCLEGYDSFVKTNKKQ